MPQASGAAQEMPHYEVHDGRGPYLLLVHGMLSSRSQWLPNLESLSKVCRPVVLELLGHGRSPAPREIEAYHPDRYVEIFERIRRDLGAESWMLLGQSLGAALTLRYALTHPDRVSAHLLTNSNSAFADAAWTLRLRPAMEALVREVEAEGAAALERIPIHPKNGRSLSPILKAALVADAALHDPRGVALTGLGTTLASALGDRICENRVPSLLICGTREQRFADHRRRVEKGMPGLEIVDLDGGHSVNLDAPLPFNRAAQAFVSRRSGAA